MRRLVRILLLTAAALELLYLVVANAGALIAPQLASRNPERTQLAFRAFSPFPGLIYVRDFRLRAQDRYSQWQLEVDEATVWADLRALRDRTFHVRHVDADGVSFKLRKKLQPGEVQRTNIAALPEIPGFAPVPIRSDKDFEVPPPRPDTWTIRMEDVNATAREVWVDGLRYEGGLTAKGGWRLKLENEAEISPANVELHGGTLLRDGREIARNLRGTIAASIASFPAHDLDAGTFLQRVNGEIQLKGDGTEVSKLAPILYVSPRLAPSWNGASFAVDARLTRGVPQAGANLRVDVRTASVSLGALRAHGGIRVNATVLNDGLVHLEAVGSAVRLHRKSRSQPLAENGRVRVTSSVPVGRLDQLGPPRRADVSITGAQLSDASAINDILPEPLHLTVTGGRAKLDAKLRVDVIRGKASGKVHARARGLDAQYDGTRYRGDADATLNITGLRADATSFGISGTRLDLRNVRSTQDDRVPPWSGHLEVTEGSISLRRKEIFRGSVKSQLSNARPLFAALLQKASMPGIARKLLTPNHVTAQAKVGLGPGMVRIDALDATVGRTAVRATARLGRNSVELASELKLGVLRAGVMQEGGRRTIHLFPRNSWFERVAGWLRS